MSQRHVLLFFLDGVGLGSDDPAANPFVTAQLPQLTALLGDGWLQRRNGRLHSARASLVATDANLGVDGRPQSATGQAAILTGRNVPALIGKHWGPWPVAEVADIIRQGTLFDATRRAGLSAALLNPYPQGYFDAVNSGRRLYSSVVLAAVEAGVPLLTADDLRAGRAVSPGFTNDTWRERLNAPDMPRISAEQAGQRLAHLARRHQFSFFDHWPTDMIGHRGPLEDAVAHLELIDSVIGGLVAAWDMTDGLLIITSDHGNIEAKDTRSHTRNPVPTIIVGADHRAAAERISALTDIAPVVRDFLGIS